MVAFQNQIVPAHMWHLERAVRGFNLHNITGNPAETIGRGVFMTLGRHQLHSDADAQKRAAFLLNGFYHSVIDAFVAAQLGGACRESAITGQIIAEAGNDGLDVAAMRAYARERGSALRAMTFHDRARMIKAMALHLREHRQLLAPNDPRTSDGFAAPPESD